MNPHSSDMHQNAIQKIRSSLEVDRNILLNSRQSQFSKSEINAPVRAGDLRQWLYQKSADGSPLNSLPPFVVLSIQKIEDRNTCILFPEFLSSPLAEVRSPEYLAQWSILISRCRRLK